MNSRKVVRVLVCTLIALLVAIGVTRTSYAQTGASPVFCGALGAEDCALLQNARTSMSELTSGSSDYQLDFYLGNMPNMPVDEAEFTIGGNYTFVTDAETLATLHSFQAMDPQVLAENSDALMEYIGASVAGIDSAQELYISLPEAAAELIASNTGLPAVTDLELSLRIVDGVLYLQLEDLASVIPELGAMAGWLGIDLQSLLDVGLASAEEQGVSMADLTAMQSSVRMPGLGIAGPGMALVPGGDMEQLVEITRLRDAHVNEGDAAVFAYNFDVTQFVSSPAFQQIALALLQNSGAMEEVGLSSDDLSTVGFALQMIAPVLFEGLEQDITSAVGLEDEYIYDFHVYVDWEMGSAAKLIGAMNQGASGTVDVEETPSIELEFVRENHNLNAVEKIEKPDNALVLPVPLLLEFMDQLQAQSQLWLAAHTSHS